MECNCYNNDNNDMENSNKVVIKSKYEMTDMSNAYQIIRDYFKNIKSSEIIEVNILNIKSENYISAERVFAKVNVPSDNTSTMDGYAVKFEKFNLKQDEVISIGEKIYADYNENDEKSGGNTFDKSNSINTENSLCECVYITTGSKLPSKFDTVIPIEYFEQLPNNKIRLLDTYQNSNKIKLNSFIRKPGSDVSLGDEILLADVNVTLNDISVLISLGITSIKVYRPPVIGVLSTGDEIVDIKDTVDKNSSLNTNSKIIDTNRITISNLLNSTHPDIVVKDYGIVNDDILKIESKFKEILNDKIDILITSGGVSMGEKDLVKKLLEQKGEILFGRLNMKPGKPTTFGKFTSDDTSNTCTNANANNRTNLTVFALPGNPVSCVVCYYLLIGYAIKAFQVYDIIDPKPIYNSVKAKLLHDVKLDPERPEYSRGVLYYCKGEFKVHTTGNQQSSRLKSLQKFNCLICLPKADGVVKVNSEIECLVIKGFEVVENINFYQNQNENIIKKENILDKKSENKKETKIYTVGTITISDRAYKSEYSIDQSTEKLKSYFSAYNSKNNSYAHLNHTVIPDEKDKIKSILSQYVNDKYDLIITSGGTGLSPRDVTTEAVLEFIDKEARSVSTYIIAESSKITKFACLSNPVVGIKGSTLIVTLPGSPKAIDENMGIIEGILPHILNQVTSMKDFH